MGVPSTLLTCLIKLDSIMAKTKGIKWSQILTFMAAIAETLQGYATKADLASYQNPHFDGDTLVFPAQNAASFNGDELILTE